MGSLILLIVAVLPSLVSSIVNDLSCEYRPTAGTGEYTFDTNVLNDGEFSFSFKVLTNSDVRIMLSPYAEEDTAAYVITIGQNNLLTTIKRYDGSVLVSHSVADESPFRESELRCMDHCMNGYWICFQSDTIKLGRAGDSAPYLEYQVPSGETFNPRYVGFATGSTNIGLFGDFRFADECVSQGSGSELGGTTTKQPRDCRNVDCGDTTCAFGFKTDSNGCQTCDCKDSPCDPLSSCTETCKHGHEKNEYQCETCTCTPGPCDDDPCQNGAYCYGIGSNDYGCYCMEGYSGKNCEEDVQEPSIKCPGNMNQTTDEGVGFASVTYPEVTATDNSGQEPSISCTPNTATLPVRSNLIQCVATDDSNNKASCSYTILITDEEPPKLTCSDPINRPTDSGEPFATVDYDLPLVEDNYAASGVSSCDKDQDYKFPIGDTEVTCTALDLYGNEGKCSFNVTVSDQEPPKFECPLPMLDETLDQGESFATVDYTLPDVTDNVDSDLTVSCTEGPGSQFPVGEWTVTCSAIDKAGNSKECSFPVEVEDDQPPKLVCPDLISNTTDPGKAYATLQYSLPQAVDNADPKPAVSCELGPGSKFWVKPNTVVCTATDKYGNSNTCDITVEIKDEELPKITCPEPMENVSVDTGKAYATVDYAPSGVQDNEDRTPDVSCDGPKDSQFDIGESTVTCTVTDRSDNSASCSFTINVIDDEKPKIICPIPMPDVKTDTGKRTATVDYGEATATDNADPNPEVTCDKGTNTEFGIGTTTVRCKAIDDAGNKKGCKFDVTVEDDEEPTLECPESMDPPTDEGKSFATVEYPPPAVSDNVDASPKVTCSETTGSEFSFGPTTVECTAVDSSMNEATCNFTINVKDTEKPELDCPIVITEPVEEGKSYAIVEFSPNVFDNVDPEPQVSCTPPSGEEFDIGKTEVTCTAVDDDGNFDSCDIEVLVEDNEGPIIKCQIPMPSSADPGSSSTFVNYNMPTATDNSGNVPTIECVPPSGSEFTIGTKNVTCTATDSSGNSNQCSFGVIVKDTEAPTFDCPDDMAPSMDEGQSFATVSYKTPTAEDNWDNDPRVTCTPRSATTFNAGKNTVTCTAIDTARNKKNCTFTIFVEDTEEPSITCPIDMDEPTEVGVSYAVIDFETPKAFDNADPRPKVDCDRVADSQFDIGSTSVNCTARDNAGNEETCTFTIVINDEESPNITCPSRMDKVSVDWHQAYATVNYDPPTVRDNADLSPSVSCVKASGSEFGLGETMVTCTASDKYGNSKSCKFPINVVDDEKPEITCPDRIDQPTDRDQDYATVIYPEFTVKDYVDDDLTVTCQKSSGSKFYIEDNHVTCTARDDAGNEASCTFPVVVTDEQPPKLTCPVNMTKSLDEGKPYATIKYTKPTATDNVDPQPEVSCNVPPDSEIYELGLFPVTCIAIDYAENANSCMFTVEVKDEEKPKITCPMNMAPSTDPGEKYATILYTEPIVVDNFDPSPEVTCSVGQFEQFQVGSKTVTCTATDSSDNTNSCTFKVTVGDTEPPSMQCRVNNIYKFTDKGKATATVDYALPDVSDNVDPSPSVSCNPSSNTQFSTGSTTITCTATDSANNVNDCQFSVIVTDNEAPELTCPNNTVDFVDPGQPYGTIAYDEPTAKDNADPNPTVDCQPKSNTQFNIGHSGVTCTATDSASNMKPCTFYVDIVDNEPPSLDCPADKSKSANPKQKFTYVTYATPLGQDNSDTKVTVICKPTSGSKFFIGENLVTCTATDIYSNSKSCPFTITVTDDEEPDLTCPDPMKKSTDTGKAEATVRYTTPAVTDNLDQNLTASCNPESGSEFQLGLNYVNCKSSDSSGNEGSCDFTIRVTDDEPPELSCPDPMIEILKPGEATAEVSFVASATDNVDSSVNVDCNPKSGTTLGVGETDVICSASDSALNDKTCSFTITVEDKEEPKFKCPVNMTETVDPSKSYATVNYTVPDVTDNVDSNLQVNCVKESGSRFPIGKSTVHCSATDKSGNSKKCSFTIDVGDNEAPMFDCPIAMRVPTDTKQSTAKASYTVPRAIDSVEGVVDVTCTPAVNTPLSVGVHTVSCTAMDSAGNTHTCPFNITVEDIEKPDITCPLPMPPFKTDTGKATATVDYGEVTASDNADPDPEVTCTKDTNKEFAIGTTTVRCTASDDAGNKRSCSFDVVVEDKETPKVTCPDAMDRTTDTDQAYATVPYTPPQATDNADASPQVDCKEGPGSQFGAGKNTVTCTATDKYGNKDSCSFPINVKDEEPPKIKCPDDMEGLPTDIGKAYAIVDYNILVKRDNEDPEPKLSCDQASGSEFGIGGNIVLCTLTDRSDNSANCSFRVEVVDIEKPDITCPLPMPPFKTDTGKPTATVDYGEVTASDNADPDPEVTCSKDTNTEFAIGTTTVRCTALDDAGNKKPCSFDVVVEDEEEPKLTCPKNMLRPTDPGKSFATVPYGIPSATDNVDANPSVTCVMGPGSEFSLGKTNVTCTAIDSSENEKECTFTIEVEDKEAPELECPIVMTEPVDEGQSYATVEFLLPKVRDNTDSEPDVNCEPSSGDQFDIGETPVLCTATDDAGNVGDCSLTITVEDNEGPTITCHPPPPESADQGSTKTAVEYDSPDVTDNSDEPPIVDCDPKSGSDFTIGSTEVTCTATDGAGNTNECTFSVVVKDSEPPDLTCPVRMTEGMDEDQSVGTISFDIPEAVDNWDKDPQVACTPDSGSKFNAGENVVVCTATDASHNKQNCTFIIEIEDRQKPGISCPGKQQDSTDPKMSYATIEYDLPRGEDNADPKPTVECDKMPNSELGVGSHTITCIAKDNADNSNTCTFEYEVTDKEEPVFNCPITMSDVSVDAGQSYATVSYTLQVATDNADPSPNVSCNKTSGSTFPLGETVVSCTALDKYGNSKTCTFRVDVIDDEEPVFDCPLPMSEPTDKGAPTALVTYPVLTAIDNVDKEVPVTCNPSSGTALGVGLTVVMCSAVDNAGNQKKCAFNITVTDEEDPEFECPLPMTDIPTDAGQPYATVDYTLPKVTDNVDSDIVAYCAQESGSKFTIGKTNVSCIATDKSKNTKNCKFSIEVKDDEEPNFKCPMSMTKSTDAGQSTANITYTVPTALDNSGESVLVTCTPGSGTAFDVSKTTVTCSATDSAGNTRTCPFTITVEDKEDPKLKCPEDMNNLSTNVGQASATVNYSVLEVSDNVDADVQVVCTKVSGSTFSVGEVDVVCTATDKAGNSADCSFSVEVKDKEKPEFDCPIDMDVPTNKGAPTYSLTYTTPKATDNVDGSVKVTCSPKPGTPLGIGEHVVTCSAQDSSGNIKTCPFNRVVKDEEAPEFECPLPMPDETVDSGQSYATVDYVLPEGTDNVDTNIQVNCMDPPGSEFPIGQRNVTCSATDSAGNSKSCSFPVNVRDNEGPKFECPIPMDLFINADQSTAVVSYTLPIATDNVDGTVKVTCTPESGTALGVGRIMVKCTATDTSNIEETCEFPVVIKDKISPEFECPSLTEVNVDPGKAYATVTYDVPMAKDNVDGTVMVNCEKPSGSTFGIGTSTVTCSATDSSNNKKTCTFVVDVTDNEAPVFTCPKNMKKSTDEGSATATVYYSTPKATDIGDGSVQVTCDPVSGTAFAVGVNEVTCSASDSAGNKKTCPFDITVEDLEAPTLTCQSSEDVTTDQGKDYATVNYPLPKANDNVDASSVLTVICNKAPSSTFTMGPTMVTCSTTDSSGNSANCTFPINVSDDEDPKFDCPKSMTVPTDKGEPNAAAPYTTPTATDNVDGSVQVTCDPASNAPIGIGETTVTCSATDSSSNKHACQFKITVQDKEKPKITCPADMTNESPDQGQSYATITYQSPEATDNSGINPSVSCDKKQGQQFPVGSAKVTCTAVDKAGNSETCSFMVVVKDTMPPEVNCPTDMTFSSPSNIDFVVSRDTSAIDDDGSAYPVTCDNAELLYSNGPNTVTCQATDANGNTAKCTFDINIKPEPCEIRTEMNSYNTYKECATPLDPKKFTQVCFNATSAHNVFVAIWHCQDPVLQPGMVDLNIYDGVVEIMHNTDFVLEAVAGFSSEPKMCVRRELTEILILFEGRILYSTSTTSPKTEVGFASSDAAVWTVMPTFGSIADRRRRRSVDDDSPLREAVQRRRRRSTDEDDGTLKVTSTKLDRRRL
ncbi:uncharacterized protein LOC110991038 [Acanthaster planci]|uniref:Uncharacterized protein LOC110991038 n=1 Tax=Acanthaster planci TaxID=133434 RepID=A0A8B8A375_ACAPL|nr:uncharacterized protein LOC110991038 [Acanthaster planci]